MLSVGAFSFCSTAIFTVHFVKIFFIATALLAAFAAGGAFALPGATSKDAALVVTLPPGNYSVQVSGVANATGVALVEV